VSDVASFCVLSVPQPTAMREQRAKESIDCCKRAIDAILLKNKLFCTIIQQSILRTVCVLLLVNILR
jgi:hypothetical protein